MIWDPLEQFAAFFPLGPGRSVDSSIWMRPCWTFATTADIREAPRQLLSLASRARAGRSRAKQLRRCVFSSYCEGLDQKHRPVTCKLWDREGLAEPGAELTDEA
jgi:hypothetical protein